MTDNIPAETPPMPEPLKPFEPEDNRETFEGGADVHASEDTVESPPEQ